MTSGANIQIAVRVDAGNLRDVDELATQLGLTRAEFVRRAIVVYTRQTQPVVADLRAGRVGPWAWLFGPKVMETGDGTDAQMVRALRSLASRIHSSGDGEKGLFDARAST